MHDQTSGGANKKPTNIIISIGEEQKKHVDFYLRYVMKVFLVIIAIIIVIIHSALLLSCGGRTGYHCLQLIFANILAKSRRLADVPHA